MSVIETNQRRLYGACALIAAALLGFALAKWTSRGATASREPALASAEAESSPTKLDVDESHLAAVGIELEGVTPGSLGAEIRAAGAVSAAPDAKAVVTAHATGTVISLDKQLGDSVRAGETLARVESREAAAIAAERDVAISKATLARSVLQREQGLFEQHVTPRQDLEAAQAQMTAAESEERRARTAAANAHVSADGRSIQIVSPISGHITAMAAQLGSFVQTDTELFRVADASRIQIEASVTAAEARRIAAGDPAIVAAGSRSRIDAVVRSVTAAIDEQTRAATVILTVAEPLRTGFAANDPQSAAGTQEGLPAPGEFVQVMITPRAAAPEGLVISAESVQRIDGRDVVFVRTNNGFRVQPVIVGSRSGGRALITSGLQLSDRVAARNAFFLKAELSKGAEGDEE